MKGFYRFAYYLVRPIFWLLFGPRFVGRGNLPAEGALMLCPNHRSYCDPIFVALGVKRQVFYIARDTLFRGFFGKILRALGAFPVNRENVGVQSIRSSFEVLEKGDVMGIFPEGTRSLDGEMGKFKAGAVMISAKTGAPMLPVAIITKGRVRPFRRVTVRFGEPVTPAQLGITGGSGAELRTATRELSRLVEELLEQGHRRKGEPR